jgi:hypothetical protein
VEPGICWQATNQLRQHIPDELLATQLSLAAVGSFAEGKVPRIAFQPGVETPRILKLGRGSRLAAAQLTRDGLPAGRVVPSRVYGFVATSGPAGKTMLRRPPSSISRFMSVGWSRMERA